MKLEPAVRKTTLQVGAASGICLVLMLLVFLLLHILIPNSPVPFDYTVVLAGLLGTAVAVLNFLLMGITVQKIAGEESGDEKLARNRMKVSYTYRMLMLVLWLALAVILPCFFWIAGILPLLFPRIGILLLQWTGQFKPERKDGDT